MDRPTITSATSPEDITDWYWKVADLRLIAKRLGVPSSGTKGQLVERLRATLAGEAVTGQRTSRPGAEMPTPLSPSTVVPAGARMTRQVRAFMIEQVGPGFRFDATMRDFFAAPDDRTLGDAVELWWSSRGRRREISPQFEYNRFTREFWASHPDGTREQLREAWNTYKELSASQRRSRT